jgi:26S proteasome regulatory subunit N8
VKLTCHSACASADILVALIPLSFRPPPQLLYKMQDVFNLVPNLRVEELVKAFAVTTNDQMLVVYMAALVRSVVSLHSLISNKIACRDHEQSRVTQALDEKKSAGMCALH